MSYINQLLELLFTPYGLIGSAIALILITIFYKEKYRPLHWFLVALTGFAASLKEYRDPWIPDPPDLVFPLEQIRAQGRPITIILLGLLLIIVFLSKRGRREKLIPSPLPYLFFIQGLAFVKTAFDGSLSFALLALLTFAGLVVMMIQGPSRWLETETDFKWGVSAIAMTGIIFAIVNLYQGSIDLYAITFKHGRLMGTTGNSQHAATLLATTIPAFLFLIEQEKNRLWLKGIWIAFLALLSLGLVMTGSRTGVGMAVIGILLFYGFSGKVIARLAMVGITFLLISVFFEPVQQWLVETIGTPLDRFSGSNLIEDTRTHVWSAQWQGFTNYPFLGKPLTGERLSGYGENSWLGGAAAFGLMGFIPLLLFGWECLRMMFQLYQYGDRQPIHQQKCNLVIAGLLSLLAGSFFEAYLLGNITFSLMAILQYLILGNFLVKLRSQEKWEHYNLMFAASDYG